VGVPLPSRFFPIDLPDVGPPTQKTDHCGEFSTVPYGYVEPNSATIGNFIVGLVSPLLPACLFRKRRPNLPIGLSAAVRRTRK